MILKVKTEGLEGDALKFAESLNETLKDIPQGINKAELDAAIEQFKKDNPAPTPEISKAAFEELTETVNQLKEQGNGPAKVVALEDVIKENGEKIKKSFKTKGTEHEFIVKADTLRASVANTTAALRLADIGQLAYRKLTIYDIFPKIPVGKDMNGTVRYTDWDQATTVRAAAAIAEAGTFPESTAKWAEFSLSLKKIGDTVPISEEFAFDDARFAAELQQFLQTNVAIKIDTDLVSGDGTGSNILGINAQVPAYVPVAAGIPDASIYDLIVKVRETITGPYGAKYQPNVILMNISDINKMKLKKDSYNNYVMPPFFDRNGNIVDGVLVLECNSFAANTAVMGDSRYGKIYEEDGFYVATGYNGTDFGEDMMTMKARKRMNLLIRTVDQTGWLKITDITAALATIGTI